ncbi:MAG TPA: monomeric [FeFe] hydrogenase [Spirochaetota bacterium]|nr:monomeric [FeFe] hydrogenase [Spirochaetota bacterium]HPF07132.1 monomeric [FeFe] hydrogenase [Spirochaetota bacterium]HPJ43233.1 monomeric [FeFe] hydrogenase [Spirochaetota bacterium]HPR38514.1 monomeric [FeFe] hydrogenase [Spirochaetota bacterium]
MPELKRLNIFEKMRGLYTDIMHIRRSTLIEIAKMVMEEKPAEFVEMIPFNVIQRDVPTFRDSVFAERAIIRERVRLGFGLDLQEFGKHSPVLFDVKSALTEKKILQKPIVNVIKIGCERCPTDSFMVSDLCRACIAHPCTIVCPKDCIAKDDNGAVIDQDACIRCGKCAQVCPYNAIIYRERPCSAACGVDAIGSDQYGFAEIDQDKCVSCGQCIVSCPFGAIGEKSEMVQILFALKKAAEGGPPVWAEIAPSFTGQLGDKVTTGQFIEAVKRLGFAGVMEVAYGADVDVLHLAKDLAEILEGKDTGEKPCFIGTSCCPSWAQAARNNFPELSSRISKSFTPMVETAKRIKEKVPDARIVFIGPCISKKDECFAPEVEGLVDHIMTFEELNALVTAAGIDAVTLTGSEELYDASVSGRKFPVAGGVAEAIIAQTKVITGDNRDIPYAAADTLENCMKLLKDIKSGRIKPAPLLVEGMACPFGCIGGPGTVSGLLKAKKSVKDFAESSKWKLPSDYLQRR